MSLEPLIPAQLRTSIVALIKTMQSTTNDGENDNMEHLENEAKVAVVLNALLLIFSAQIVASANCCGKEADTDIASMLETV